MSPKLSAFDSRHGVAVALDKLHLDYTAIILLYYRGWRHLYILNHNTLSGYCRHQTRL
jgi:hypothetical protein